MNRQLNLATARRVVIAFVVIVGVVLLLSFAGQFFYLLESVQEQEVGIQFRNNRIYQVVGPGVYSDFGLFVSLETISAQAIPSPSPMKKSLPATSSASVWLSAATSSAPI